MTKKTSINDLWPFEWQLDIKKQDTDIHKYKLKLLAQHMTKHTNWLTEDEQNYFKNNLCHLLKIHRNQKK